MFLDEEVIRCILWYDRVLCWHGHLLDEQLLSRVVVSWLGWPACKLAPTTRKSNDYNKPKRKYMGIRKIDFIKYIILGRLSRRRALWLSLLSVSLRPLFEESKTLNAHIYNFFHEFFRWTFRQNTIKIVFFWIIKPLTKWVTVKI